MSVGQFKTEFSPYSLQFSPFFENRIACACAQHFGIVGNGRQLILNLDMGGLNVHSAFDTQDGLYDCAWSEENENILVSGSGDGSIKIWDVEAQDGRPIQNYQEHMKEVYSVDWNLITKETFLSGSWDYRIKLWTPRQPVSLATFEEHEFAVYSAIWSPAHPERFASAAGDRTLKIWDINEQHSVQTIHAHNFEVLSCDWNKYDENIIATGSVDKSIKIWDLRNPNTEVERLQAHTLGVRRVKFSPHSDSILASCSYDMSVMIWDLLAPQDPLLEHYNHHTEFVVGLDFNLFINGQIATCSWDDLSVEVLATPVAQ